jgi:MraZ protein
MSTTETTHDDLRGPAFTGSYERAVDAKGRFNLPFRFRRGGGVTEDEQYVVTKGADGSLSLFPREEWIKAFRKAQKLSKDGAVRAKARKLSAMSRDMSPDAQGRVMVPRELLDLAGIDQRVLVVGMGHYMELWRKETFDALQGDEVDLDGEFMDEFFF